MAGVATQFGAPAGIADAANGVSLLGSDSTAKGIGLKLMSNEGVALHYDTQYQVAGYSNDPGRTYTIQLKASYTQTGASVTPGTANGMLTFTMTYQ